MAQTFQIVIPLQEFAHMFSMCLANGPCFLGLLWFPVTENDFIFLVPKWSLSWGDLPFLWPGNCETAGLLSHEKPSSGLPPSFSPCFLSAPLTADDEFLFCRGLFRLLVNCKGSRSADRHGGLPLSHQRECGFPSSWSQTGSLLCFPFLSRGSTLVCGTFGSGELGSVCW